MNIDIDNLVNILGYIISGFVGYKVSKAPIRTNVENDAIKTQLYSVYLPLFKSIENNLYKKIDKETALIYVDLFENIKSNNYEYIDAYLLSHFRSLKKGINSDFSRNYSFYSICYIVDKQYEKLKKKLYLPKRGFFYKWLNNQLPRDTINFIKSLFSFISKLAYVLCIIGIPFYLGVFIYKIFLFIFSLFTH